MAVEVERKFLLGTQQWKDHVVCSQHLEQGYLSTTPERVVRVRIEDQRAVLTIKGISRAASRAEYEYEIPLADARQILATLAAAVVRKTRHTLDLAGAAWTVDCFEGQNAPLQLLEIEGEEVPQLSRADLPAWVGREVTDDHRYQNLELSVRPYRTWAGGASEKNKPSRGNKVGAAGEPATPTK